MRLPHISKIPANSICNQSIFICSLASPKAAVREGSTFDCGLTRSMWFYWELRVFAVLMVSLRAPSEFLWPLQGHSEHQVHLVAGAEWFLVCLTTGGGGEPSAENGCSVLDSFWRVSPFHHLLSYCHKF